jgi:predicted ABC-type ATPase
MLANNRDIYERIIKPDLFGDKVNLQNEEKFAIYLAGQPGSGKTSLREEIIAQRDFENTTIVLNTDSLREYHPDYVTLMSDPTNYEKAPVMVNEDASAWFKLAEADAKEKGLNIIYDTTMGANSMTGFLEGISKNKMDGYTTEIHVLAVNENISRLGVHARYESENSRLGYGRMVSIASHDNNYNNLPKNLKTLSEIENLIDQLAIYSKTLNKNRAGILQNGKDQIVFKTSEKDQFLEGIKTLNKVRNQPLSEQQKEYYTQVVDKTEKLILARNGDLETFRKDMNGMLKELSKERTVVMLELGR